MKTWIEEMTLAYCVGVEDGKHGNKHGYPNEFHACYEQGWQHGSKAQVRNVLATWDQARQKMRECLTT